ncbi:CTD small phosphatase-like protein 2 [Mixophyes fleayi]|uniref:CTD small phosphatase-like protein 2 n=1 Tax=Mixophyes fleayi TaxID=3061075 RepID=UPI003F4E2AE3
MILRSRKIPAGPSREPNTPKKRSESGNNPFTPQSTSKGQRRVQLKSPAVCPLSISDEAVTPFSKKQSLCQVQNLRNCLEEEDLQTPLRQHSVRVHFQLDESSPESTSPLSSPDIFLYSSRINRSGVHRTNIPDCKYFSHVPEDEAGEVFNQYKFICSAQATSYDPRQRKNDIPFKTRSAPESTLVLDLEGVLVESSLLPYPDADFTFLTPFQDRYYKVYLKLRPHVGEFLEKLCKIYEIFVFTTAKKEYAENIVDILDPQKKLIRHRLYQEHCVCVAGHYVKDLGVLHRDLAKTVAMDTVAYTLPFHITNRIPVHRWTGSRKDKELLSLFPALEQMTHVKDVRLRISNLFHVDELVAES